MPVANLKFTRRQRLLTRDFATVLRSGKLLRGTGVSVLLHNNRISHSRLGIIVPKRIVRRAVDRNRLKRIFREWFRHNQEQLAGKDCVVRLSVLKTKGVLFAGGHALARELERLISVKGL